jgi:hypothetical protein
VGASKQRDGTCKGNLTSAQYAAILARGHAPAAPPVARRPRTPKFARPVAVDVLGKFVAILPLSTVSS